MINQWITYLLDEEITPSRLELYVRALCHLYDFAMAQAAVSTYMQFAPENRVLLKDFVEAKQFGTDWFCLKKDARSAWLKALGLYWRPLLNRTNTIDLYLKAIEEFDRWQVTFHGSVPLNPYEERFMTSWEIYRDFKQRSDWDPFRHLHPAKNHNQQDYDISAYGKYLHGRHQYSFKRRKKAKAFPLNLFPDLIEKTKNPRDKLLWLLMGAGSLRASETLHLFQADVQLVDLEKGGARITLGDPETSYICWTDKLGQEHCTTREEYFRQQYTNEQFSVGHPLRDLQPRTKYGKRHSGFYSGFKGMTFAENENEEELFTKPGLNRNLDEHYIWWLDNRIGQYFWQVFEEYQQNFLWRNPYTGKLNPKGWPWHPWLFISTSKAQYGMPLTMAALKQSWKRAVRRIGLEKSGLGMHSLRHMYGYYCANVRPRSLGMTQMRMHHANINSTQTYFGVEGSTVRNEVNKAAIREKRIEGQWTEFISKYNDE